MTWTIPPRSDGFKAHALQRQSILTKPTGALGTLENIAVWLADIQQTERPSVRPAAAIIFASDHPVSLLKVSAYPREVTPMMVVNLATGGAAASVLANSLNIPLHIADVGAEKYDAPQCGPGITWSKTQVGGLVGDLISTDAMDETALKGALEAGATAVNKLESDTRLVIFGEMGIGNTTPSAAVAARLLGLKAEAITGPGTGVSGDALTAKIKVVQSALDRTEGIVDPMAVLRCLGGREIAAIVGAMGRAAERGMGILVDGFIVSVAALVAARHQPSIVDHMFFCHRSAEPGHRLVLEALNATPMLDAGLRLGEGSGALTAFPLFEAAVTLHNNMATFEQAAVPNKES